MRIRNTLMIRNYVMASVVAFALLAVVLLNARTAGATLINFNTHANGSPFVGLGDFFPAAEYAGLGVTINDSDPTAGNTEVNLTNAANVGTAISGYYVNVGAFAGTPTSLTMDFSPFVLIAAFDFATFSGNLSVTAFGSGGVLLGTFNFLGSDPFKNQFGFDIKAGNASLAGIGPIGQLVVTPIPNEALILDNLNFRAVPEPGTVWLLLSGLVALGLAERRRIIGPKQK